MKPSPMLEFRYSSKKTKGPRPHFPHKDLKGAK